jgi:adenylate cyclase, class 2
MKNQEIEVKFRLENEKAFIDHLNKMGFINVKDVFETNIIFDMMDGSYSSRGRLVRVRETDKGNILTYKEKQGEDSQYKVRTEIETSIDDSEQMIEMLKYMGFIISFVYQKKRMHFTKDDIEITIDKLPFGNYIEIEATKNQIVNLSKELNLEMTEISNMSYLALYYKVCWEQNIQPSSVTAFTEEDTDKYKRLIHELQTFNEKRHQ